MNIQLFHETKRECGRDNHRLRFLEYASGQTITNEIGQVKNYPQHQTVE
jgi:hypothetical protein